MKKPELVVVVMAGGIGERFWPKSRKHSPKQCLRIFSRKTLIEETVERLKPLAPKKHFFIATGEQLFKPLKKILPEVNFVLEPFPRNTAACLGLSALHIEKLNPEAVMVIETADHIYQNVKAYLEHLRIAVEEAKKGHIVTLGIKPTRPETGFGYIHKGIYKGEPVSRKVYSVDEFVEKPALEQAREFLASKDFLWNSGIFICKCNRLLQAIKQHMPELHQALQHIRKSKFNKKVIAREFQELKSISIDYGVMEKENDIVVVEGAFPWDDIGDWSAMERMLKKDENGNVVKGKSVLLDASNCLVFGDKLAALLGVKDLIVVSTDDAVLICNKRQAQRVKELTQKISRQKKLQKFLE